MSLDPQGEAMGTPYAQGIWHVKPGRDQFVAGWIEFVGWTKLRELPVRFEPPTLEVVADADGRRS
jgi:hypothetical protein